MVSVCVCFVCYQSMVLWCLSYLYFIFIGYVGYGISGDVVISAEKRNVAISLFPRKVDVICCVCHERMVCLCVGFVVALVCRHICGYV